MNKQNNLFDKAFEMMLEEAATKADEKLGESLNVSSEEIVFSEEHEKKMKRLFNKERRTQKRKKYFKYTQRIACILLAFVLVSGVTIFSVDAWRIKFLNFVLESNEPNTDFNFSDNGGTTYSDDNVILHYVPMGFEIDDVQNSKRRIYLRFSNGDMYFGITVNGINGSYSIDTENAVVERITINNNEGIYSSNENINILVWHDDEYVYRITANISEDEIIKIAENLTKK